MTIYYETRKGRFYISNVQHFTLDYGKMTVSIISVKRHATKAIRIEGVHAVSNFVVPRELCKYKKHEGESS